MQATKASSSCKHRASSTPVPQAHNLASSQPVLAHTRALHPCKPQRQATAACTEQAANLCKQPGQQLACAGSQQSPAPMQATSASTEQSANLHWLTPEPSTKASHKGEQQLQAHSQSPALMQTTKAGNNCKHGASSKPVLAHKSPAPKQAKGKQQLQAHSRQLTCTGSLKSPAPMQATQASNSCKHRASS